MEFETFSSFLNKAEELLAGCTEFIICTVVNSSGSSPQKPGSRMIVTKTGNFFGTVGGGKVESVCIEVALNMLRRMERTQLLHFDLSDNETGVCGGSMDIFLEGVYFKKKVLIFGAGHVSEAVCDLLKKLGYYIFIFDDRAERLSLASFHGCEKICAGYEENPDADVLVMTSSHLHDFDVIKKILGMNFRSIGLLGSRRKRQELISFLKSNGFTDDMISKVRVPVGIEINSRDPYEIAVSVAAEFIKMNSEKK